MIFMPFNLNGGATTVRISGQGKQCVNQPIRGRAPQEIVASTQVEISRDVSAPRPLRALGGLSESDFPRFIEFGHLRADRILIISR
jgi:hypothetical protein